jgi:hypothetical protein
MSPILLPPPPVNKLAAYSPILLPPPPVNKMVTSV